MDLFTDVPTNSITALRELARRLGVEYPVFSRINSNCQLKVEEECRFGLPHTFGKGDTVAEAREEAALKMVETVRQAYALNHSKLEVIWRMGLREWKTTSENCWESRLDHYLKSGVVSKIKFEDTPWFGRARSRLTLYVVPLRMTFEGARDGATRNEARNAVAKHCITSLFE